jgi:hypothetical protein
VKDLGKTVSVCLAGPVFQMLERSLSVVHCIVFLLAKLPTHSGGNRSTQAEGSESSVSLSIRQGPGLSRCLQVSCYGSLHGILASQIREKGNKSKRKTCFLSLHTSLSIFICSFTLRLLES